MRRRRSVALLVLMLCGRMTGSGEAVPPGPKVGDLAPPFSLQGSDGRTYSLADYRGVRPVVLAWFPKSYAST